jgi:hypothetical protein
MTQQISPQTMKQGLEKLDGLAVSEYGRSLLRWRRR